MPSHNSTLSSRIVETLPLSPGLISNFPFFINSIARNLLHYRCREFSSFFRRNIGEEFTIVPDEKQL